MSILIILLAALAFLAVLVTVYVLGTNELIKKHQAEWDSRKRKLIEAHEEMDVIYAHYSDYIDELWENAHPFFGSCFPYF